MKELDATKKMVNHLLRPNHFDTAIVGGLGLSFFLLDSMQTYPRLIRCWYFVITKPLEACDIERRGNPDLYIRQRN